MFKGFDYFLTDELLSEEERMVRDTVRQYVEKRFLPLAAKYHDKAEFPLRVIPELAEMGLLGITIPEKYGAAGSSYYIYGLAMQELERGDSGLRSFASVQGSLVMFPVYRYGSEAQKEKWLPLLASGKTIGCFGLTEPDHGSDPGGMRTSARRTEKGWLLNGSKMWITNATIAHLAVVWAQTEEGIRGFLVETDREGFSRAPIKGKYSLRASNTGELIFDNCFVPDENRLPEAKGLSAPLSCLNEARYGIAWGATGAAMACYDEALRYAQSRIQFDKPIAAYQLTQHKLVEMASEIVKAQLLNHQMGRLKDKKQAKYYHISMAKRNNVHQALQAARTARTILGANGITDEYQTVRHLLNLESVYTYEGTHDIHTLIIGEYLTGSSAFR